MVTNIESLALGFQAEEEVAPPFALVRRMTRSTFYLGMFGFRPGLLKRLLSMTLGSDVSVAFPSAPCMKWQGQRSGLPGMRPPKPRVSNSFKRTRAWLRCGKVPTSWFRAQRKRV